MIPKSVVSKYLRGRRCIFCNNTHLYRLQNKQVKCSSCKRKYSLRKLDRDASILYYFYLEVSARKASRELGISYKTARSKYMQFRYSITDYLHEQFIKMKGHLELDESYFGGKRKGKRGRGAYNKAIVFGILERNGKVYTTVVPNVKAETLMDEIKAKTRKGSVFYTDQFKSYKSLVMFGKHIEIDHSKKLVEGNKHINGIEGFWSFAKERFHKYHGIGRNNYYWYLNEMEFRFNYRNEDIFKKLVQIALGGNLVPK
jgi:transposase